MKKIFALLLMMFILIGTVACGGTPTNNPDTTNPSDSPDDPADTTAADDTDGQDDTTAPADDLPASVKTIDAELWTLNYDSDVWKYDEEYFFNYEDISSLELVIADSEDEYALRAYIRVSLESPADFRDSLVYYGFDEYEYAVNNSYKTEKIGGYGLLKYQGESWGEPITVYIGRIEGAGASINIQLEGDDPNGDGQKLLEGLQIKLDDIGNEDGPWYWEGTPFSAEPSEIAVGDYTVKSRWIPFEECVMTREVFDHYVAVSDGLAYIASDGSISRYLFDGNKLTFKDTLEIEGEYDSIQSSADGTVWASGFMEPLLGIKDGEVISSYEDSEKVTMHPGGEWGISWFSSPECALLTKTEGGFEKTGFSFAEVESISYILVNDNYIFLSGRDANDEEQKVMVYDKDRNHLLTLGDEEGGGLGCVTYITESVNGFIGFDGNMREIILWDAEGKYIGKVSDGDLFGTGYPWFCGGTVLEDGSILMVMTDERADESATELIAFLVTVE